MARINIPKEKLAAFCKKWHVRKLSLFGSVLRDDFRPESDVDLLVVFEEGRVPGLITFSGMELELDEILGRKTDLRTPEDLSRYFRDEVVRSAVEQYAA
ncbi:MAG: nucleotidyltransferase family protein [Nitrospinae bacterium]|nr:nucleotidyltransferase family protein [Nitrospinota bacterium]